MDEAGIIQRYLRPLTGDAAGTFDLQDDAAFIADGNLIITKDVLVEGVHFRADDPLDLVAKKALRVNLSDLAAKGARPAGYFLGCVWPGGIDEQNIACFADGLKEDGKGFRIPLLGGDTTRSLAEEDPFVVSVTMLGHAPKSGPIQRAGALPGDDVYVSGTIGDAFLGLEALSGRLNGVDGDALIRRYHLPEPRLALGGALAGVASAALDVSDGLVIDGHRLADRSDVMIEIIAPSVPLSPSANEWLAKGSPEHGAQIDQRLAMLATGGDDYEILFTALPARRRAVDMAAQITKTKVTRIGRVKRGGGLHFLKEDGAAITLHRSGYDHFSD